MAPATFNFFRGAPHEASLHRFRMHVMATSTATPSSETNPGGIAVSSKKTLINTGIGNALE